MTKQDRRVTSLEAWNSLLQLHEENHNQFPSGKTGLKAIQIIHEFLGPEWDFRYEPGHWLKFRLWRPSEPGYTWLSHFAKKLETLLEIPGAHNVISRLDSLTEYSGAWSELDFALKLHLTGFSCEFVQNHVGPSPDLRATKEGKTLEVEVASMNPLPIEVLIRDGLIIVQMTAFTNGVEARGLFSRAPKPDEIDQIETVIRKAAEEAKQKGQVVKTSIRGLMTCYVAPRGHEKEIPEPWNQGFSAKPFRRISMTERLGRVIGEKAGPQLANAKVGLLSIYDNASLRPLWAYREKPEAYDTPYIELALGAFPNISGAVLIQPFVSVLQLENKNIINEGARIIEHSLPDFEAERITVWPNSMADDPLVLQTITDSLIGFPLALRGNLD